MRQLIKEIKQKLNIDGGFYTDAEIEDYIQHIDKSQYLEFFKALSGNHDFAKSMDRIANVAKQFKNNSNDILLAGTREQAKSMYQKFYNENCAMTDYTQANRDKVPNDREFFKHTNYAKLKRTDGSYSYTKQEIYVLNELGGGEWLMDIKCLPNTKVAISKIEKIIKDAIQTKYSKSSHAITDKRVSKMLSGE